ncbi:MAG: succinate dehydrogenase, cytochrome b556 subunit [Actinobacteria bacterium]|nr:succinate dehydrogenase, cytochrome b556 subunit [Actinomycetota bacterium]
MRGIGRLRAAILRYRSGRTTVSASTRLTPSIAETTSKTPRGTLYRGREGMWSWVLHRITGIAIFFFLLVHVLDTSLIRVSPEAYDAVLGTYKNPIMGIGETVLVAAIVFHALNGLRIILVDVWSKGAQYQKQMFWIVIGLWLVLLAGFVPRHLINVFSHVGGAS